MKKVTEKCCPSDLNGDLVNKLKTQITTKRRNSNKSIDKNTAVGQANISNSPLGKIVSEEAQSSISKKKTRHRNRKPKVKCKVEKDFASSSTTSSQASPKSRVTSRSRNFSLLKHVNSTIQPTLKNKPDTPLKTLIVTPSKKSPEKVIKHSFTIQPVKIPSNSYFFKRRNKKNKYIQLKSFKGPNNTIVFITTFRITSDPKNKASGNKYLKRKYFKSDEPNSLDQDISSKIPNYNQEIVDKLVNLTIAETSQKKAIGRSSTVTIENQKKSVTNKESQIIEPKKETGRKLARWHRKVMRKQNKVNEEFVKYIKYDEMKKGLETGELFKGFLRINPKNSREAYISNEDTSIPDYYISSIADRNRALDGDEVVFKVKPKSDWSEGKKTATIVYILKKIHPRTAVGTLTLVNKDVACFCPRDKRVPNMDISPISWPNGFSSNPELYEHFLFVGQLIEWRDPKNPKGMITQSLGQSGDLKVETQAILKEFCLDITPFSQDLVASLPISKEIPAEELSKREDIRDQCVFTIDPLTARDLDDALSVKELPNGNYEIGVHISDASYYLSEGTDLDKMVSGKATTIYLVDNVYHMLPVELCLHCSLLPGEDKLAFSVFWEMNESGQIFSTRFTRTVINSCAQLAYEHAQQMIEDPDREFKSEELPRIFNDFTAKDLSKTVNILKKIAANLRAARIENGSLRIDQIKLLFSLEPATGEPLDFKQYENKESHRLIEEFMLLANISVATKINETFPEIAFLRCHEPPKSTMLSEAQGCLETCGIHIDVSSSGGIHESMRKYITNDFQGLCRGMVLNHMLAKTMTRARYFCSGTMKNNGDFSHYALSVPIYTHFTSPIRRYADIMVHRLLAASLGYSEKPKWSENYVKSIAENCNLKKYSAKKAGEASSDLYLARYIEKHQPYIDNCVVIDVKDRSFDAIIFRTGNVVRIHQNKCQDNPTWTIEKIPNSTPKEEQAEAKKKVLRLVLKFPETDQKAHNMIVEMFSVVKVKLRRVPKTYKLEAFLLRPLEPVIVYGNDCKNSE